MSQAAISGGTSAKKASDTDCIPVEILEHRLNERVSFNSTVVLAGKRPIFNQQQEKNLAEYLVTMYSLGHGLTRADIADIASQYAVFLGRREKECPFDLTWVTKFVKKWPELKGKLHGTCRLPLSQIFTKFFDDLEKVVHMANFPEKSHLIFSVSDIEIREDGTNSGEEKMLATVLACGSADGVSLPPFFIYPEKRTTENCMKGALPGSRGVVSDDGCVNAQVFSHFLEKHLLSRISTEDREKPVLVHVNGFKFCSVGLKEWANSQNLILFFPPADIGRNMMPIDVGCIDSFQELYSLECERFIQETSKDVQVNNICEIVSKVFWKAFSSYHIREGYRKTGLFPCNRHMIVLPTIL